MLTAVCTTYVEDARCTQECGTTAREQSCTSEDSRSGDGVHSTPSHQRDHPECTVNVIIKCDQHAQSHHRTRRVKGEGRGREGAHTGGKKVDTLALHPTTSTQLHALQLVLALSLHCRGYVLVIIYTAIAGEGTVIVAISQWLKQ